MDNYCSVVKSPIGDVLIFADQQAVNVITFAKKDITGLSPNAVSEKAAQQLRSYFDGQLQEFDFPMAQTGTEFQQTVWQALLTINYGDTISYLKFSEQLNNPLAIRAIAATNGKNNIAIVVPCHRVIGSNGKLVGYAGELWRKQWLLEHEREILGKGQMSLKF
ncbi:methylated-DNA--[protein]-cysteine S-methyltransferase [Pedobacter sp. KR3-3]|uniref:Methylated-DNA--protein-cysteine methyltransferase n=1 Tax=Pedobacter albus TaxID=3113905 RepID=A0ABU7I661_9SPHI|nr:methylated-DNA--[protein]-cysteine S-methyltransferase [Pedobacter sp. KR3-3]MEE1944967.1 methylated-DNA--[protein]-cysteine S-methyltransferase [Pedobacter sp. KR3-3]